MGLKRENCKNSIDKCWLNLLLLELVAIEFILRNILHCLEFAFVLRLAIMSKYHAFHELETHMITKFLQILQESMCHKQKQQHIKQMFPSDVSR